MSDKAGSQIRIDATAQHGLKSWITPRLQSLPISATKSGGTGEGDATHHWTS
jgi:hypothetical protein